MNLAKAHQKARMAMRRREEQIEQEELEGGEINLIPYLDIVTNLMLFLLASISAGLVLGQINTTLPDRGPKPDAMQNDPRPAGEKPLHQGRLVECAANRCADVGEIFGSIHNRF